LLSDHQPHPITELYRLALPPAELDAALTHLMQEELIRQDNGLLYKG